MQLMYKKLSFSNLNTRIKDIFETEDNYEGFRNLRYDLNSKAEMFDDEGNRISKKDAEEKVRKFVWNILEIDEKSTKRDRKRAMRKHGNELFEVLEEDIDFKVDTGFHESEFFNQFVDERNIKRGDSQEFWTEDNVILSVSKIAGDHHDFTLQRLGSGQPYTVPTSVYGIAVGADIDLYLAGRLDWSKFTDACAKAFIIHIQNEMFAEVMNAGNKLPVNSQFNKTMAISAANKETFDTLIEDVSMANGNVPVTIFGTRTALKKLTALADIDWVSEAQKNQFAELGRLGSYEGTALFEIPQRFAPNDVTKKLVDSTKLLIMPQVENKFVKFVDVGETEIYEVTEKGERMDDTMKYEVQRTMGIGTQIGCYFGVWTIA